MITKENFFMNTFALYKICKRPKRKPDYISYNKNYGGMVSSEYWYGSDKNGDFVIRSSNHWVLRKDNQKSLDADCNMISSCNWQIILPLQSKYDNDKRTIVGKAYFSKFKKI